MQTWSWKAIGIYFEAGYAAVRSDVFDSHSNEYALALPILESKMDPRFLPQLRNPV
jgi:hypothetical protein